MAKMLMLTVVMTIGLCLTGADAGSYPRVRIFNPKQGNIWFQGETRNIIWRMATLPPPPNPPTVNITLRRKSDPSFKVVVARSAPTSPLEYAWKIPSGLPNADDFVLYMIPNRAVPAPGRPNIMASKSKPFTIVSKSDGGSKIAVTQPKDGAVWYGGQSRFIQWQFKGLPSGAVVSIFIRDVVNKVVGYPYPYEIAHQLPALPTSSNTASYKWQVPYEFRTSEGYVISVVAEFPGTDLTPIVALMSGPFKIVQVGDAGSGTPTPISDVSPIEATPA